MNKSVVGSLGTKKKPRASNGKLKTTAPTRHRRKSQGFSSSFTQKTMHNNTLLAQSLAKEKSRNEKMLTMQRDLIASRNEALMRLNEIETSFERMGMMVKKGIKQLQDIATTMGDLYSEIQLFRNNPRDSASMRSPWEEKNCRTRASSNISRMQTVKPMVDGHMITTQPRISLPRIDSRQENTAANEPSPNRCSLLSTSFTVPAIEEESEGSNSDDDEVRNDSLVCRAPRQSSHLETMQEFYDRVYAQDPQEGPSRPTKRAPPRIVRKVPRGVTKLAHHNLELDSSSDECSINNTTTLCLVDMDETVVADSPVVESASGAAVKENKSVSVKMVKEVKVSPALSYEKVLAISASAECQAVSEINITNTATQNLGALTNPPPISSDVGANSGTQPTVAPDSPDFLGFPVEDNSPDAKKSLEKKSSTSRSKLFSCASTVLTKSPTLNNSLSHVGSRSSLATSPNVKLSSVPKLTEVCLNNATGNPTSLDCKGSGISNCTNGWNGDHFEQVSRSGSYRGLQKLTNSSPVSKSKCRSLVHMKNPTVLLSDVNLTKLKSFADGSLISDPQKHSAFEVLSETAKKTSLGNCSIVINNQSVHTKTSTLHLEVPNIEGFQLSPDVSHRKSGRQTTWVNTPVNPIAGEIPLETKSASECQKVLLIELERLPAVSKSALVQPVTKKPKVSRTRRNTHVEDNENTNHVQASSQKRKKRNSPFPPDLYDTPARRSKARSPNAVVLVTKLDVNPTPSDTLEESSSGTKRRVLRRIPPMNYKELPLNLKARRHF